VQLIQAFKRGQKRLLRHVLRIFAMSQLVVGESEYRISVLKDQTAIGFGLPSTDAPDKLCVGHNLTTPFRPVPMTHTMAANRNSAGRTGGPPVQQ
jgi:hypothetical protein